MDDMPPRSYVHKPPQRRSEPSAVERAAMWFVHDWNRDDPCNIPEMAMSRDVSMLFRMVMTYDPHGDSIKHLIDYHWLNATMEWTGPEVLGGAPQVQFFAGCFTRRVIDAMELGLGRTPPPSIKAVASAGTYLRGNDTPAPADATEDDVLRSVSIDPFGHNLTQEEAEMFVSYLTAPYTRIPCVAASLVFIRLLYRSKQCIVVVFWCRAPPTLCCGVCVVPAVGARCVCVCVCVRWCCACIFMLEWSVAV